MVQSPSRFGASDQLLCCVLLSIHILCTVNAVTHWVVTERGRIQASRDSSFALRRPYDLAAVFQQMDRANEMKNVRDHLRELQPKEGVKLDESDIWSLQKEVMESDDNCKAAGKPVYEFDFYTSTVLPLTHFGLKLEDYVNIHSVLDLATTSLSSSSKGSKNANPYQEPKCWIHRLDFSMYAFEHLSSMRNRKKMASVAETALRSVVVPTGMTIDQFGHAIQQTLKKNQGSWVAYSMASFFWRMKGNTSAAIECLRRALHYSPQKYKAEPLLNLGNILHRNGHSDDASIVVQWALDISPGLSVLHFTMANILASLERDDEASKHYEASLQLQPRLVASAQLRLHAVRCRQALVAALNRQAKEWESALTVLRSKQARLMAMQRTISKMREEQSPEEFTTVQEFIYLNWIENERRRGTIKYCQHDEKSDYISKLKCPEKFLPEDHLPFWADRLEAKLGVGRYADPEKPQPPKTRYSRLKSQQENQRLQMLYTGWVSHAEPLFFESMSWPSDEDCKSFRIPKWTDYDPILLPPVNKGFNLTDFLLNEESGTFPDPICSLAPNNISGSHVGAFATSEWLVTRYLTIEELNEAESFTPASAEPTLQRELLAALGCNRTCLKAAGGDSALPKLMAKAGRVLSRELEKASKNSYNPLEVEKGSPLPLWLLQSLSISYWHSIGQLGRAAECSRAAVRNVPLRYRDIPLTALSGLLYRLSAVEESTEAIAEAVASAPFDPQPNYFMGCMLAVKGDLLDAMSHFTKALRQLPSLKMAERQLRSIACYQRQKISSKQDADRSTADFRSASGEMRIDDSFYEQLDFLNESMTLFETQIFNGRVTDIFVKEKRGDEISIDAAGNQKQKQEKRLVVEYSELSIPYARLVVNHDGKLFADPHLITMRPPPDDVATDLGICLVFANGTMSTPCSNDKSFMPYATSIKSLAKHFADALQPKADLRSNLVTLECADKSCGANVLDHFSAINSAEYPRNPATISKFISSIVKNLSNQSTNAVRLKPTASDPLAISIPGRLIDSDFLENQIRLLLAVSRSAGTSANSYTSSTLACSSSSVGEGFSMEAGAKTTQLPDPLTIVSEGRMENVLNRLNPECSMPGVALRSSTEAKPSERGGTLYTEPYCECTPPYLQPPQKSTADDGTGQNFSTLFTFSSLADFHYPPETNLQPWAAHLQTSLKLESSRQLAVILASHLHHTSRSNVCSDDAHGWLPFTLAARYWRLRGNAAEATRCLSAAVASSSAYNIPGHSSSAIAAIPLLELSDFLRHVGYLPHSLVAAASALVFPNHAAAAAAASRLGSIFSQIERLDAAVIFYELAASAAAAFAATSTSQLPPDLEMELSKIDKLALKQTQGQVTSLQGSLSHANILMRLHATTCKRDRNYRRAAMLLRRLVRGSAMTPR